MPLRGANRFVVSDEAIYWFDEETLTPHVVFEMR
jgi:hypothetical protein